MRYFLPLLATFLSLFLSACGGGGGGCDLTTLIDGPAVGANGNNSDNPFRALAIHPTDPNTLYVGSEGNGLFKSTDGGVNWTWLRAGIRHCGTAYPEIYSIAIDTANPTRVYFAGNAGPGPISSGTTATAGVYQSTDSGASWTQLSSGLPTADTNSVIVTGGRVIVGLGAGTSTNGDSTFYPGGIYNQSTSRRGTWAASTTPTGATESLFWQIVERGSFLFTFGGTSTSRAAVGVLKSTDGGLTWSATANALGGLKGAHIDATTDGQTIYANQRSDGTAPYFYKSVDGGGNWTNPASVASLSSGPIRILGNDANTVLAAGQNAIYRTTNAFTAVTTVLNAATSDAAIMAIESAPSSSSIVYATTKGLYVYKSTDAGLTFTLQSNIRSFLDAQP